MDSKKQVGNMFKILAIINRAIKENKKVIFLPNSKLSTDIVKILYEAGYILNYFFMYNKIKIEFTDYQNKLILNQLKSYNNLNLKKYVTFKQLKRMVFLKKKRLLLSTCYGIILGDLAIKYRIGGYVISEFI